MNRTGLWISLLAVCLSLQGCVSTGGVSERPVSKTDAARANYNLGAAYLRQGRADLAVENLKRALEENPRFADAHSAIALAYDQLGDLESAEEHYKRATQLDPSNAAAQNIYAVFLCRHDRWPEAERYFQRAADNSRYETPEAALTNAGTCARNAGDLEKAEQYFRAALERNPEYPDALDSMLELSYQQKNYLQARAFIQRSFEAHEPNARQLWLCFRVEQELDNPDRAEQCARRLRTEFPDSPEFAQLRELERDAGR